MRIARFPAAAIAAAALAFSGCGDGPDPLVGTWKLTGASCNGYPVQLSGGYQNFALTYGSDGTFSAKFTTPAGCSVKVSGTYARNGLSVTETQTQLDCGAAGCNNTIAPACNTATGVQAISGSHSYFANVPSSQMEQTKGSPASFCAAGASEAQDYARQ